MLISQIFFEAEGLIFTRLSLTHYIADRESLQYRGNRVLSRVADKVWQVRIGKKYPFGRSTQSASGP